MIKWLGKIYGDIKVKKRRKHHYLGMDFDFQNKGAEEVSMIPYVKQITKSFPEEIGNSCEAHQQQNTYFKSEKRKKQIYT